MIASSLFVRRVFSNVFWGYISDTKGTKLPLIISTTGLGVAILVFGFSKTIDWALSFRFIEGLFMSLNVLCRSALVKICDETNISLGYSIILSTNSVGRILGPSIEGFLVFPAQFYPSVFSRNALFAEFPILLPMGLLTIGLIIAGLLLICFLPNDVDEIKNNDETSEDLSAEQNIDVISPSTEDENESSFSDRPLTFCEKTKSIYEDFKRTSVYKCLKTRQCMKVCALNGCFSFLNVSCNETFPLFAVTNRDLYGLRLSPNQIGIM